VSLNNRILIRDTYEVRGGVIDCEVVTVPGGGARSEAIMDTIILEAVKPQEDLMKQPVAEFEVEESVNSKSCGRHIGVLLSYASSRHRNCGRVMPIIRTGGIIYGSANYCLPIGTLRNSGLCFIYLL
jgi:hypothetical protein